MTITKAWETINKAWKTITKAWTTITNAWQTGTKAWKTLNEAWKTITKAWKTITKAWKTITKAWKTLIRASKTINITKAWKNIAEAWKTTTEAWKTITKAWKNINKARYWSYCDYLTMRLPYESTCLKAIHFKQIPHSYGYTITRKDLHLILHMKCIMTASAQSFSKLQLMCLTWTLTANIEHWVQYGRSAKTYEDSE